MCLLKVAPSSLTVNSYVQNLSWLSLESNKIETLPTELGALTNLAQLWLANNMLIELPESLSRLSSLVYVD